MSGKKRTTDQIDMAQFFEKHKRVPMIHQGEKPWRYRGWLLWYVQRLHEATIFPFPDRWGYLQTTVERVEKDQSYKAVGEIPPIEFDNSPHPHAMSNLKEAMGALSARWSGWVAFEKLVAYISFGLGLSHDDPFLPDTISEKVCRVLDLSHWLLHPHDYLGTLACEGKSSKIWNPNAFFPTPHSVVEMMVKMTMQGDSKSLLTTTVHDPALGTGRMLLHAANHSLFLSGQDIDPLMVAITKINGAVYAPWIVCPPPVVKEEMGEEIRGSVKTDEKRKMRGLPVFLNQSLQQSRKKGG